MLTIRDVSLVRDGHRLLSHVDLAIAGGERLLILGPNGAGKTLLMQVAHRLVEPTGGEVIPAAAGLREAMVFQRPVLLRRSVLRNVLYAVDHARPGVGDTRRQGRRAAADPRTGAGKAPAGIGGLAGDGVGKGCGEGEGLVTRDRPRWREERLTRAEAALRLVGLQGLSHRYARVLSAGEQQRVALARAAALAPDLIWLDEPTASLDPSATRLIESIVMRMSGEGVTCVMSTHDIGQARRLAQRVLLMAGGRIIEVTPAERFFSEPATEAGRRYLGGELLDD